VAPDQVYLSSHVEDPGHARALLESGFGLLTQTLREQEIPADAERVHAALVDYCVDIITHQWAHEVRIMRGRLELEALL
jgi:hypothetical protein